MLDVEESTATRGFFKLSIFHFASFFRLSWRTAVEKTSMSAHLAGVALSWQRCCVKYWKLESYVSWLVCLTSKNHGVISVIPKVYFSARIFFQELFLSMIIYCTLALKTTMPIFMCLLLICGHTRDEGCVRETGTWSLNLFYVKQGSCIISRGVS